MTVEGRHEDAVGVVPGAPLQYGRLGIMAETQLDDGKNCFKDMIGTGPFKFKGDWVPNDHLTVVKNPNYWRKDPYGQQLPYLDKITFKPVPDGTAACSTACKSKAFDLAQHRRHHDRDPAACCPSVKAGSIDLCSREQNPEVGVHDLQHVEGAVQQHPRPPGVRVRVRPRRTYNSSRNHDLNRSPSVRSVRACSATSPTPACRSTTSTKAKADGRSSTRPQTGQALTFTLQHPERLGVAASAQVIQEYMQKAGMKMSIKPDEQSHADQRRHRRHVTRRGVAQPPRLRPRHPVGVVALQRRRRRAGRGHDADEHRHRRRRRHGPATTATTRELQQVQRPGHQQGVRDRPLRAPTRPSARRRTRTSTRSSPSRSGKRWALLVSLWTMPSPDQRPAASSDRTCRRRRRPTPVPTATSRSPGCRAAPTCRRSGCKK